MTNLQVHNIIGLMSGTSGDGLDIAYCHFKKSTDWSFQIVKAETLPFPEKLGKDLSNSHLMSALDLSILDVAFGKWMGEVTNDFVLKYQIDVQAIASHGHTVFHQPQKGLSLQIGNGWAMHVASGLPVINDFRMLDVQLGGQGAPLVPIGDELLFSDFDYCINLGGIANISMNVSGQRRAFDICPFNLLLNHYAKSQGQPYDQGGGLARSGKVIPQMLDKLNAIPYYKIDGAKSLGREDVEEFFQIIDSGKFIDPKDKLRTIVEHSIFQIKSIIKKEGKLLLTGGGAFNTFFVEQLKKALGESIVIPETDSTLINFKEALIFAFLGVQRMRKENNSLASVTGANQDSCGGILYGFIE